MKYFLLVIIFIGICQAFTSGINSVVSSLADYQTKNGGFRATKDTEPTLEATAQAMFLSSLFGLRDKINSGDVLKFIDSLHNPDHGYSNQPGQPSDLESVRHALLIYTHLGIAISNSAGLNTFIQSLYDRETKLYANTFGSTGDAKSTAIAFQCLSMLNLLQSDDMKEKQASIKKNFMNIIKKDSNSTIKYFSAITSDNYYGIVVAHYVGIDFEDVEPWAKYFRDRQVKEGPMTGGFYADQTLTEVVLEDVYHSVSALHVLQQAKKSTKPFTDTINTDDLVRYSNTLPRNLKAAALAYTAIALTSAFKSTFKITTQYDVNDSRFRLVGDRIIQGTQVKPVLSVRTHYGLAHAGLDVSMTITLKSTGDKITRKLTWNADNQMYLSDEFYNTATQLGEVTFDYVIRWLVADLGKDLTLFLTEKKTIGYDLSVRSKAIHAGKEIEPKGIVGIGTEFAFDVRLGTQKQPKPSLRSGDFDITFSVHDSSDVVIHQNVFNARDNSEDIHFRYSLSTPNIPAGDLTFIFEVGNKEGVHTVDSVSYSLPLTMVASRISFEGFEGRPPVYKIGDTVVVHVVPGSLPDLRTVQPYPAKDYLQNPVKRKFYMDLSSAETQATLFSLEGTGNVIDGFLMYKFELPVAATFYAIGNNVVTFHYETANGKVIPLQNYDSQVGELFEDGTHLNYTVKTELHIVNSKNAPKDGNMDYGNEVKFSFQVMDEISKQLVFGSEQATVYLVLRHKLDDRQIPITSSKQAAYQINEKGKPHRFSISWSVNPNAVKGAGIIELVAQGADGQEIPIFQEKSQSQWQVNVNIGGTITVEESTFSSEMDEEDTSFLVQFELSCQNKKLKDAELLASISFNSGGDKQKELIATLPVTHGREAGRYQVSWVQPNKNVKSGEYIVEFYRQVDWQRMLQKGGQSDLSLIESLFTVKFNHKKTSTGFFIRSEVIALLILGTSFFWMVYQKMEIEGTRKKVKKGKKPSFSLF